MTEDIDVSFPGGKRVDARLFGRTIATDQPVEDGGQDGAPAPFELFLASIATCAGIYALGFCQSRGISTEGLALKQTHEIDPETHLPTRISIHVTLPRDFPEKYRAPLLRSVGSCKVKKAILSGLSFDVKETSHV